MDQYKIETWNNLHIRAAGNDYEAAVSLARAEAATRGEAVKLVADRGDGYPEARMIAVDGRVDPHWGDHRPSRPGDLNA